MAATSHIPAFPRTIFHVDMDAFFVSVEELYDPRLKGKAVVVGGQRHERGVVSAASYEARKFGVHSALPLRTAAKLCPQAIFVDGHPERYRECSENVYKVLTAFSPQVEMASIDEAYLDMTGTARLHGPPLKAAHKLHQRMKEQTQLNCSIGIGSSRLIAKVSSAQAKPNGLLWIVPGEESKFLAPLAVREIPGVGKVMESHLHGLGIKKVGDLARLEESELEERFGKWGLALAGKARGEDAGGWFDAEVGADTAAKSISHEHTYNEDTADLNQLEATLMRLSEMVGRRLREARFYARTIQLKLRYKDFSTITRAHTCRHPVSWMGKSLTRCAICFARTGSLASRSDCWESRLPHLRRRRSRLVCSKPGASSAGKMRWPPPTACATGLANRAYRWRLACGEASASARMRIRRGCREKTRPRKKQNRGQNQHLVRSPIVA
jgi:DNA polymerase-4